jgi:hypothetical protein
MSATAPKQPTEADLKCLFLRHLRKCGLINLNSVIASEYSLGHSGRRVDLAIFSEEFIGVEFKSRGDTLKRLQPQLDAYVRCFDRVILVTDERHVPNAQSQMPPSVELWSVDAEEQLHLVRSPVVRASRTARALAQLCNMRQLKRLTSARASSTLSRSKLVEMATDLPFDVVYKAAIGAFKDGFVRSSATFWSQLGAQEIDRAALSFLSRTSDFRQKRKSVARAQSEFWLAWADEAASIFGSKHPAGVAS